MNNVDLKHLLDVAIWCAVSWHFGQRDKTGQPYILHPMRVMGMMDSDEEKIAAILHDVIEDCGINRQDLKEDAQTPDELIDVVEILTREDNESYNEYIQRVIDSKNLMAIKIKLADLEDNMSPERFVKQSLIDRYQKTKNKILEHYPNFKEK